MIESRSEKKEDGLRSPLTEARRGAEPKVRTPLPHDCAGVALGMELAAPCGARRSARNEKKMEASTWSSTIHEEVPAREQCEAPAVQGERSRSKTKARLESSTVATATPSTVQPRAVALPGGRGAGRSLGYGGGGRARPLAVEAGGGVSRAGEMSAGCARRGSALDGGDALLDGTADGDGAGGRGAGRSLGYG